MSSGRFVAGDPYAPPTPPRVLEWVDYLDVDLDLAQRILRMPVAAMPPVPRAPGQAPPAAPALRGAYARRASANRLQPPA